MKKLFFVTSFVFILGLVFPTPSFAQGMMGDIWGANNASLQDDDGHTAREEAEGKEIWEKLQKKELACEGLSEDNFEALGEYFMGQSIGDTARHIAMNEMMKRMLGEEGEKQAHAVMGKRSSGCDLSAAFPAQDAGFFPMMSLMRGDWSPTSKFNQDNNPLGCGFGGNPVGRSFGFFSWIFLIIWWMLIIAGLVTLIKWLAARFRGAHNHKKAVLLSGRSPFEILKERYAKGEIDRKEFEEKKMDLK